MVWSKETISNFVECGISPSDRPGAGYQRTAWLVLAVSSHPSIFYAHCSLNAASRYSLKRNAATPITHTTHNTQHTHECFHPHW